MFGSKNEKVREVYNLIGHIIGDSDKTKNYLDYIDNVARESVNIKTLGKLLGFPILHLIEDNVKYIVAILSSITLLMAVTFNNEILTDIGIVVTTTIIVYKIGTMFLFKNLQKDITKYVHKTNKAVYYIDDYDSIYDFVSHDCKHYTEEVLTIADLEDFTISTFYRNDIFKGFVSTSELGIPLYFLYYTVAAVCIEIMVVNGWFNSIGNLDKFLDDNDYYWCWHDNMKTALNSREEDKGELLYKLTVVGLLLRAKREIEFSQED